MHFTKSILAATAVLALMQAEPVNADPFGEAFGSAIGGAILGGIIGGRDGAAVGAAIGGLSGYSAGSARQDERRRNRAAHRHQRQRAEWERRRMVEQSLLDQQRMLQQQQFQMQAVAPIAAPAFDRTLVIETQKSLIRLGGNPGGVDGRLGPQTIVAIKSYQNSKGLLETGRPSQSLLMHMLQNGG